MGLTSLRRNRDERAREQPSSAPVPHADHQRSLVEQHKRHQLDLLKVQKAFGLSHAELAAILAGTATSQPSMSVTVDVSDEVQAALEAARTTIDAMNAELEELRAELTAANATLDALRAQVAELEANDEQGGTNDEPKAEQPEVAPADPVVANNDEPQADSADAAETQPQGQTEAPATDEPKADKRRRR